MGGCRFCTGGVRALPLLGCLYDIEAAPSERKNLARHEPAIWRDLHDRIRQLEASTFSPDRGHVDIAEACSAVSHRYNGFWGPWVLLDSWPEARARSLRAQPVPRSTAEFSTFV